MSERLGWIHLEYFLSKTKGKVKGQIFSDAKIRTYESEYRVEKIKGGKIKIQRNNGSGDTIIVPAKIPIDREQISFFGLYSGDGAKGSENRNNPGTVKVNVSFSQKESNIILFVVRQFNKLFPNQLRFTFSLGEDSAFFMAGKGFEKLKQHYGGVIPNAQKLSDVKHALDETDKRYLSESRNVKGTNEEHLAFYYQHKKAMQKILTEQKTDELSKINILTDETVKITASVRRPFKKGARQPGGTSRADELHIGGLNGLGELFLKIMYEIEDSVYADTKKSLDGLIEWNDRPSLIGDKIDLEDFFNSNLYGSIAGIRPKIKKNNSCITGQWPRSAEQKISSELIIDPVFAYASGLYLAEGTTPKNVLCSMFSKHPSNLAVGFTSTEDSSFSIILRALNKLVSKEDSMRGWKIKVGSQYFAELVSIGLKQGVPMLRGGNSGDGKLRTMEISLSLKSWALKICPSLIPFSELYSHVEPTGAGVARIDFWASSTLGKWFFPLIMFTVFSKDISVPHGGFIVD